MHEIFLKSSFYEEVRLQAHRFSTVKRSAFLSCTAALSSAAHLGLASLLVSFLFFLLVFFQFNKMFTVGGLPCCTFH